MSAADLDIYDARFDALRASIAADELMLVRKAFQDQGYCDDDAIRSVAHRVVEQAHKDGEKTWTLDGAVVLRLGPLIFSDRTVDGRWLVSFTRGVAFS